jgi:predicted DsbA family dithiol-disulfide isomerase
MRFDALIREMPQNDPVHLTVYADYACPFCYLGKRSLDAYRESSDRDLTVEWQPFDLRAPDRGPKGAIDRSVDEATDPSVLEYARENVRRLREQYDAEEMRPPDEVPDHVDSFAAQAASLFVQSEYPEQWAAFDDAIYEALWVDGRNIGDHAVLTDIAAEVGIDPNEVRYALSEPAHRDQVRSACREAREMGVTGVPTFVAGGNSARGAIPPEQFDRLLDGERGPASELTEPRQGNRRTTRRDRAEQRLHRQRE